MSAPRRHHAALAPGYRLHWYEIESILGQGGFGITYLARDTNLDQKVAIKEFLPTDLAVRTHDSSVVPMSDAQVDTFGWGLNRFIAEAQTLARFQHPNIVVVHSVFEENNTAYMVMSYVEGETLEDAFKFRHIDGEEQLLAMLHPLLDGLEQLHDAGYIHRDIKPDNIYIRKDGSPVLLDFGSARQSVGAQTRTLTALVSPGYAPFEQYGSSKEKERQGAWTDIYALGATMYRGVTGKGPPDAIDRANELMSGRNDILIPTTVLDVEGYSTGFLRAIDHAIEFLPEKRPQSIAGWRAVLPGGDAVAEDNDEADAATVLAPETATELAPDVTPSTGQIRAQAGAGKIRKRWIVLGVLIAAVVVGGLLGLQQKGDEGVSQPTDETAVSESRQPVAETLQPIPEETSLTPEEIAAMQLEEERLATEARLKAEQERLAEIARQQEAARLAEEERLAKIALEEEATRIAEEERLAAEQRQASEARLADEQRQTEEAAELARIQAEVEAEQARLAAVKKARLEEEERQAAAKAEQQAKIEAQELARIQAELQAEQERLASLQKARKEEEARQAAEAAAEREAEERARIRAEEEARLAEAKRLAEEEAQRLAALKQAEAVEQAAVVSAEQTLQQEIADHLSRGEEHLKALRLTSPADDNAYQSFNAVLALDPHNDSARRGMRLIVEKYVTLSERAVASANFKKAEGYLVKAERIAPGSENIEIARDGLVSSREKHAKEQLARAAAEAAAQSGTAVVQTATQEDTTVVASAPAQPSEIVLHREDQTPIQVGNNNGDWGTDLGYRDISPREFVGKKVVFQFNVDIPPSRVTVGVKTADVTSNGSCYQYVELNDHSERLMDDGINGVSVFDIPRRNVKIGQNTLRIHSESCQDEKVVVNDFVIFRVIVTLEP